MEAAMARQAAGKAFNPNTERCVIFMIMSPAE
jgi:hypothetical protein